MKRLIILIFFASKFLYGLSVYDLSKINPDYNNEFNPFLRALNIHTYQISLNRDSARVTLYDKSYIDIFIKEKQLWNIRRYDKDNNPIPTGNLKNGNGKVIMTFGSNQYIASFRNGILNDTVAFKYHSKTDTVYRHIHIFKDGLMHGNSYIRSMVNPDIVSVIITFDMGFLTKKEGYGVRKQFFIPIPFFIIIKQKIVNPETICSRTIYDKGKMISHDCFVPKCRKCGF